jgi:hypothetical protein
VSSARRALLIVVAAAVPAGAATAANPVSERVVVLDAGPLDTAFADRIRGQVSDLPFEIATVPIEPDAGDEARRKTAERLAAGAGVAAVVWYAQGKVSILRPQRGGMSLTERSFSESPRAGSEHEARGRESASAHLEAAAVVVRFALLAPSEPVVHADAARAAAGRPSDLPPAVARPGEGLRLTTGAMLGWQALRDGLDALDASLLAEATVSIARFEVGPFGTVGGGRSIGAAGGADANLRRQSVGLIAGVLLVDAPRLRVGARMLVGVASFELTSRLPGEAPQTDDRVRFFAGAEARVAALLTLGRVPFQLSLGLGVVAVNAAPVLYSGATVARRLSTIEPRSVLGVGVLFR